MLILLIFVSLFVLLSAVQFVMMFRRNDALLGLVALTLITVAGVLAVVYGAMASGD